MQFLNRRKYQDAPSMLSLLGGYPRINQDCGPMRMPWEKMMAMDCVLVHLFFFCSRESVVMGVQREVCSAHPQNERQC